MTKSESIRARLASAPGLDMGHALLVFLIVDGLVVAALCAALAPRALYLVLPLMLGMPLAVGVLMHWFLWRPWEKRCPAAEQRADAVVKKNESFMLGRGMWIKGVVHIAADADHLHLIPFLLLRWGGAGVISMPWERITDVEPIRSGLRRGYVRAKIDGRAIAGPGWCMRLAVLDVRHDPSDRMSRHQTH